MLGKAIFAVASAAILLAIVSSDANAGPDCAQIKRDYELQDALSVYSLMEREQIAAGVGCAPDSIISANGSRGRNMRLLMIASLAALVVSAGSLTAIFQMALNAPTQHRTGLPWTANVGRNIADASPLAAVTFHNAKDGKIWVALE